MSEITESKTPDQGILNARPQRNPLTVTASGGMALSIGGANQGVLTDGFWCDDCPLIWFHVPLANGYQRKDLIAIQNVTVKSGALEYAKSSEAIALYQSSIVYMYVQGDSSGDPPSSPSGYNGFAVVTVSADAVDVSQADISYLFPTVVSLREEQ